MVRTVKDVLDEIKEIEDTNVKIKKACKTLVSNPNLEKSIENDLGLSYSDFVAIRTYLSSDVERLLEKINKVEVEL